MSKPLYLPDSDCDCYYKALELLNEALEPIDERITALEQNTPDPQYSGVSTEPKPSDVAENSIYLELDTGKFYYYHDNEWHEIDCLCSGGKGNIVVNYIYNLTNISAAHTLVINCSSGVGTKIYIKKNGNWYQYSKVYKKVNGAWVEQNASTWSALFDTLVNYVIRS